MTSFVLAIDHGTTSSRAVLVDQDGHIVSISQREHRQILPHPDWVEHDPEEVWSNIVAVTTEVAAFAADGGHEIVAVGITNQRETTVLWDKNTGKPFYNAIVWQDTRTGDIIDQVAEDGGIDRLRPLTGLPLSPYFSASKIKWIFDNVEGVREAANRGDVLAGTMDTWLTWKLTGEHVTDVSNASRTLLMDLHTCQWRENLADLFDIPLSILPRIVPSSGVVANVTAIEGLDGVPVAGILGDQQSANFGQAAFLPGEAKNTYGTANALLVNVGETPVMSHSGLITTVAYQLEGQPVSYALEGVIAVAGSLINWVRDNLELAPDIAGLEELIRSVPDNGGVYLVPAFSGLFAPHWRNDARGVIVGLGYSAKRAHIARAAMEAIAFQSSEIFRAMKDDTGLAMPEIRVDGGMVRNDLLMQFQADILGIPVVRPKEIESTALGAAYVAGLAVGFWSSLEDVRKNWREDTRWTPSIDEETRQRLLADWDRAIQKSLGWVVSHN